MDSQEFERLALADPELRSFLEGAAADAPEVAGERAPKRFGPISAGTVLLGVMAYVLFRWAKNVLDHDQAVRETEVLERRAEVVAWLVERGSPDETAQSLAMGFLEQMADRSKHDTIHGKALALLTGGKGK